MSSIYRKWLCISFLLSVVFSGFTLIAAIWLNRQFALFTELEPISLWLLSIFLVSQNLIVLPWLYWLDKRKAIKRNKERIPERILHLGALLGGGLGALYGQRRYRHKTQKPLFQLSAWVGIILIAGMLYQSWANPF
ncbi:hypothetical protein MAQ5080_02968 [Marinomonas aquimarina]|uniref:DUF1294 domain-containing protein n=1 Tax=Marinomonas aquimarina TaxID=295068 RepID=A0A1A8TLJ0_9GAMM|nr:DUF1294 domain-containing protein [Marinomonas aquimarina]SBS34766.1 hypothetical protein MAQ5080_02968 [Marinomonas aquimarina]